MAVERKMMSFSLMKDRKDQLEKILEHHHDEGRDYMSMTRIVEELIQQEHKRLKLK